MFVSTSSRPKELTLVKTQSKGTGVVPPPSLYTFVPSTPKSFTENVEGATVLVSSVSSEKVREPVEKKEVHVLQS